MKKEILKRIGIVAVIFAIVIYVVVIAVNANLNNSNELTTEIAFLVDSLKEPMLS